MRVAERMSDVHLYVFFDDLFERPLGHVVDGFQRCGKVNHRGEAKAALRDVDRAHAPGKVIEVLEQVAVNLRQSGKRPGFERAENPLVVELEGA